MNEYYDLDFLLILQVALLGKIRFKMRRIGVKFLRDNVDIYFYVDGKIDMLDEQLIAKVKEELAVEFGKKGIRTVVERIDYPRPLEEDCDVFVFVRNEEFGMPIKVKHSPDSQL